MKYEQQLEPLSYSFTGYDIDTEKYNVIFASDFHFRHNKQFIYEDRGFKSIEEHDEYIITSLEQYVNFSNKPVVLIYLGDFAMSNPVFDLYFKRISELVDHWYFITGNHDKFFKQLKLPYIPYNYLNCYFMGPQTTFTIKQGEELLTKFICSHYPMIEIPGCLRKPPFHFYNIHGHIHSRPMDYQPFHCIDAGVDKCLNSYKLNRPYLALSDVFDIIDLNEPPCCETCVNYHGDDAIVHCNACSDRFKFDTYENSLTNLVNTVKLTTHEK